MISPFTIVSKDKVAASQVWNSIFNMPLTFQMESDGLLPVKWKDRERKQERRRDKNRKRWLAEGAQQNWTVRSWCQKLGLIAGCTSESWGEGVRGKRWGKWQGGEGMRGWEEGTSGPDETVRIQIKDLKKTRRWEERGKETIACVKKHRGRMRSSNEWENWGKRVKEKYLECISKNVAGAVKERKPWRHLIPSRLWTPVGFIPDVWSVLTQRFGNKTSST